MVTIGTVGYGDIVPHTGWGRVLGAVVIVVTFISFLNVKLLKSLEGIEERLDRNHG
jgi:hypothetical protein